MNYLCYKMEDIALSLEEGEMTIIGGKNNYYINYVKNFCKNLKEDKKYNEAQFNIFI